MAVAFQANPSTIVQHHHQYRSLLLQPPPSTSEMQLYSVKSKAPRTRRRNQDENGDVKRSSTWNNFKTLVYDSVDRIASSQNSRYNNNNSNNDVQKGKVSQGYDASLDAALRSKGVPMSPAERLLMNEQFGLGTIRQGAGVRSAQQQRQEERERLAQRSSFDTFKSGVYGVVDFVTGPAPSRPKKATKTAREEDEQQSKAPDTTLAVPSKPSFNQIREQEARARAQVRNEKIRAKKEDLYRIVDSLQATVDALPETFDAAEEAVKEAISFSKTLPEKVEKTVKQIQEIPDKVEQKAIATQKAIQDNVEQSKKVVKEVQDVPNKIKQTVQGTKKTIVNTQEAISDAATSVKVLMGLEKPKPKPPKRPPPPQKKPKEIALDLAGKAAGATGKLAWWTGRNAASLAWKGTKVVYEKSIESLGPALEDAMKQRELQQQQQQQAAKQAKTPKPPSSPPPEPEPASVTSAKMDTSSPPKVPYKNIKTPEELSREVAAAQALAKEVEEALEMAERALLISNELEKSRPDEIKKLKNK
ncbi:hypothetical protein IV203_018761 [Nitzschia inconspicua]|uniref:Uncharacterized protein n=1 Tax=Nitzschia inconspicua TaxID=303405 RepID=A0A9K3M2L8_9STRA|nr:hypothetical protein IV203_018761 [Nitzschia inconspicua]